MEFKEIQNTTINDLPSDTSVVGNDLLLLARQNFTKRNVVDREFPYYSFKSSVSELSAVTEFAIVHKNENVKGYWTFDKPVSVDNYTLSGKVDNDVVATKWYADRMEKDITDRIYALSNYLYDEENPHIPSYVGMIITTSIKDEKRIKEIYGGNKWQLTCQNRFLVGASKTADEYLFDHKGGHNSIKLTAAQSAVPFHIHGINISNTQSFNTADYSHGLPQITSSKNPHRKHKHLRDYLIAAATCAAIVAVIVVVTVLTAGAGGPAAVSAGTGAVTSATAGAATTAATVGAYAAAAAHFVAVAVGMAVLTTALTYIGQQILIHTTELDMESINRWLAGAQLAASIITLGMNLYGQIGELAVDLELQTLTKALATELVKKYSLLAVGVGIQLNSMYKQVKQVKHPSNQRMHFSQTYKQFSDKKFWINVAQSFVIQTVMNEFSQRIRSNIEDKILTHLETESANALRQYIYEANSQLLNKDLIEKMTDDQLERTYLGAAAIRDKISQAIRNIERIEELSMRNNYTLVVGVADRKYKLPDNYFKDGTFKNPSDFYNINVENLNIVLNKLNSVASSFQIEMSNRPNTSWHVGSLNQPLNGATTGIQNTIASMENNLATNKSAIAATSQLDMSDQVANQIYDMADKYGGRDNPIYDDLTPEQKDEMFGPSRSSIKSVKRTNILEEARAEKTKEEEEEEEKKKQADEDRGTDAVDPRTTFWTKSIGKCPISVSISKQKNFLKKNSNASAAKSIDMRPRYYRLYIWKRIS